MGNFWEFNTWGIISIFAVIFLALLVANILKTTIPFLKNSLMPASVLGGVVLLLISLIYTLVTGEILFDSALFGGNGTAVLEIITYHALALGFIAQSLKLSEKKLNKKRAVEIFNTGTTTVATYLLQGVVGMVITIVAGLFIKDFFIASGVILPFGYGQGTGQAMNYGNIFETDHGFFGGKNFGLTIAALGFLSASIGGVIYLNIQKRRGKLKRSTITERKASVENYCDPNEIPLNGNMDKLTVQLALITLAYAITYALMYGIGELLPGMKSTIYGFNFLFGVLSATLIKTIFNFLKKKKVLKYQYVNNYLLSRVSNLFFDVMIVAGIAAINLLLIREYWHVLIVLGIIGLVVTLFYTKFVAKKLFPEYSEEQFLATYGMLTGTASTGMILLREIDEDFSTPVADNLVYQNFPAIVFGFPIMLLVPFAPVKPYLVLGILAVAFVVMNIVLFRSKIFKKKVKTDKKETE